MPILLAVVAAALVRYGPLAEECFVVCIVLLYVLELAALVCGIVGCAHGVGQGRRRDLADLACVWRLRGYQYLRLLHDFGSACGTYRGRAADHLKPSAHHWQEGSDRAGDAFSREKLGSLPPLYCRKAG